jgi:hypothetical protein
MADSAGKMTSSPHRSVVPGSVATATALFDLDSQATGERCTGSHH